MKTYTLEVSFEMGTSWKTHQKTIEDIVGKQRDFSGVGFGQRDMGWAGLSRAHCDPIAGKLTQVKPTIPELTWSFREER